MRGLLEVKCNKPMGESSVKAFGVSVLTIYAEGKNAIKV
jgi:hypothetical protein